MINLFVDISPLIRGFCFLDSNHYFCGMAKNNEYVPFILSELKKGNTLYSKVFEVFLSKFKCSEPTFVTYWKKAQSEYVLFQQERETKINEATIHQAIETHSNGLKSKSERLMNLQKQADDIQRMLDSNITPDIVKSPKQLEYMEIERKLTYIERAQLMKALRELQAEISKIEGDYAATKTQIEVKQEQPLFNI